MGVGERDARISLYYWPKRVGERARGRAIMIALGCNVVGVDARKLAEAGYFKKAEQSKAHVLAPQPDD